MVDFHGRTVSFREGKYTIHGSLILTDLHKYSLNKAEKEYFVGFNVLGVWALVGFG